jgi:DNA-binding NarL/FixJ family response regulator
VLVVTTFTDEEYVFDALAAGASGFVPKSARPEQLVHAVRVVASGDALVLPADTRRLVERSVPVRRGRLDPRRQLLTRLTPREAEVLRLVAGGLSNTEIAAELFVGAETVKSHVGSMLGKIGARDRTQAVIFAYETGFVGPVS